MNDFFIYYLVPVVWSVVMLLVGIWIGYPTGKAVQKEKDQKGKENENE